MPARMLVAFNRWFGEIHASALAVSDAVMINGGKICDGCRL